MIKKAYQFKNLQKYPHITHGISTNGFGSIKQLDTKEVDRDALSEFAKTVGIADEIICMQQIHGSNVSIITSNSVSKISETDGLLTNKKHIPLAVLTADCLPILLYDPKNEVIGVAHAGYKGLLQHIVENTVSKLVVEFKSNPQDIIVGIGPSIETLCYEVGVEVIEKFDKEFSEFTDMYTSKDNKFYVSLKYIAQQCLIKAGILEENIETMDICTKCDPNFYSYRGKDGDNRFASVISLV